MMFPGPKILCTARAGPQEKALHRNRSPRCRSSSVSNRFRHPPQSAMCMVSPPRAVEGESFRLQDQQFQRMFIRMIHSTLTISPNFSCTQKLSRLSLPDSGVIPEILSLCGDQKFLPHKLCQIFQVTSMLGAIFFDRQSRKLGFASVYGKNLHRHRFPEIPPAGCFAQHPYRPNRSPARLFPFPTYVLRFFCSTAARADAMSMSIVFLTHTSGSPGSARKRFRIHAYVCRPQKHGKRGQGKTSFDTCSGSEARGPRAIQYHGARFLRAGTR